MATVVKGYKPSEIHRKHINLQNVCNSYGVSLPAETQAYFNNLQGDGMVEVDLGAAVTQNGGSIEIDVRKVTSEAEVLRITEE